MYSNIDSLIACGFNSTLVLINIAMLVLGICADPGVPPQIYRRYTKARYGRQSKQQQKSSDGNQQSKYVELEMQETGPSGSKKSESSKGEDNSGQGKIIALDQDDYDEDNEGSAEPLRDQDANGSGVEECPPTHDGNEDDLENFGSKNTNLKQRKGAHALS